MRTDNAHPRRIDQKLPQMPEGELLTAAQLAFAVVLGQILAERWTAISQSSATAPLNSEKTDARMNPQISDRNSQGT